MSLDKSPVCGVYLNVIYDSPIEGICVQEERSMMKMNKRIGAFLLVILMLMMAVVGCADIEEGEIDWTPNGKEPSIESQPTAAPEKMVSFGSYPGALEDYKALGVFGDDTKISDILKNYVRIDVDTGVWTEYEKIYEARYDLQTSFYNYQETLNGQVTLEKQYIEKGSRYFAVSALEDDSEIVSILKEVRKDPNTGVWTEYEKTTENGGKTKTVVVSYDLETGSYKYKETVNNKETVYEYVERDGTYFAVDSSACADDSKIVSILKEVSKDPNTGVWAEYKRIAIARYDLQTGFYNYRETVNGQVTVAEQSVEEKGKYFSVDPISWIILEEKADSYVLISKDILESGFPFLENYGASTWADSTMRDWLNGTDAYAKGGTAYSEQWNFINRAFTNAQIGMIKTMTLNTKDNADYGVAGGGETKDQVYLLSAEEVAAYFGEDMTAQCVGTPYALQKGLSATDDQGIWWLRSPGYNTAFQGVDRNGDVTSYSSADVTVGVRPVICVSKQAIS